MPRTIAVPQSRTPHQPSCRPTNVTLPEALLREARDLGINLPQACEKGLAAEVSERRAKEWLRDNEAAIEAMNEYVEQNGIPLEEFRQF